MKNCKGCLLDKPFTAFSKKGKGYQSKCKECMKLYQSIRYLDKKDEILKASKEWYKANKERKHATGRIYRANNKDSINRAARLNYANNEARQMYIKQWNLDNKEHHKQWHAEYYQNNKDKFQEYQATRQHRIKDALASWADPAALKWFITERNRLEELDGVKRHIDHIHPLNHPLVCGLHVENNLQILTATENLSKGNRFYPYVESELT